MGIDRDVGDANGHDDDDIDSGRFKFAATGTIWDKVSIWVLQEQSRSGRLGPTGRSS